MKIIIAPAKKMIVDTDNFVAETTPLYLSEASQLLARLRQLTFTELKALWHCSDQLATANYQRLLKMNLTTDLTPAIMAFTGLQYQYMAPDLFTTAALEYVKSNLRILSGFYGSLRPFDGITAYRLEMQAPLQLGQTTNLYQFWGNKIYTALAINNEPVIDLASNEYAKTIRPYLQPNEVFIDIIFGQLIEGKVKTKATLAKMARGEMVRYLAENNVQTLTELKQFDHLNYQFQAPLSTPTKLVFIQK
ncbi:peroxide stress protein YaaA [Lentilactobacillus kribbianus]|uniref:peroxide stress protein YaaA n=1 Tax=Lentilactobacillus kribbianus TaxID=2729622 RepID=UPI001556BBE0|nr:peroxide stress protein YaaA [Lentilactobacillus kribbianus]